MFVCYVFFSVWFLTFKMYKAQIAECFVCHSKNNENVTFHRFTKCADTIQQWAQFCNLNLDIDDVASLYVCGKHFRDSDYCSEIIDGKVCKGKRLKRLSVPSILYDQNVNSSSIARGYNNEIITNSSESSAPETGSGPSPPKLQKLVEHTKLKVLSSPNFSLPRRKKHFVRVLPQKIEKYRQTIRILRQRTRKLNRKISTLEEMIANLRS